MPDRAIVAVSTRRSAWLVAAFLCASFVFGQSHTCPTTRNVATESFQEARERLARIPVSKRTRTDHARLAGLSFAIEIGRADGSAVAALVVPVGYQELPLAGDLPERPAKPLQRAALKARIADRQLIETTRVPSSCLDVLKRDELRDKFPAVATWMLPGDLAIIYHVSIGDKWPRWITRDACAVVRIRGRRASIVGGNVLDVLVPPPADTTAPPSDD